ncbi:MAG TPA: hypothetical protein VEC35_24235 [Noviherbaspirillum sp.]|nr:hypothetical protein [Noviherbaspirillum sp.]
MSTTTSDAGIPLLTEIIPGPSSDDSRLAPTATAVVEQAKEGLVSIETRAATMLEEEEWQRLESEIRERVLYEILERIDFVLEQRVRDSLADVLQTAVEGLATEIKGGLHVSIRDVVTRAVTHEITKLKSAKK